MRPIKQVSSTYNFPQGFVLTLALASLLTPGVGLVNHSVAMAAPTIESVEFSQGLQSRLPGYISRTVLNDASRRSGVRNVRITQATPKTFGNPCEFNFGEICTREYRPIQGWEVVVRVRNQFWTYHVNQSGSQIVLDPKNNVGGDNQLPRAIANNILNDAARRSRLSARDVEITKFTPRTFSNPCRFNFGEICTEEYRPIQGWEVVVRVRNQFWTYHVNQSNSQFVIDPNI